MLIDTHCHLDFGHFGSDLPQVLERARQAGVSQLITIGIDIAGSAAAVTLAESHPQVFATVGIHPHNARRLSPEEIDGLLRLGRGEKVVAYGEIGLDFFRDRQPRSLQMICFSEQLGLARQLNLPVVVHDREAHQEVLQVLRAERAWETGGTVLHCFSGDWAFARQCLDLGCRISIAGPVTFANAPQLQEVARRCPLDRIVLETDAPFLAPVPQRGKRNEPAFLVHTAEQVALLRGLPVSEVSRQTTRNAREFFGLPDSPETKPESK